MSHQTENFADPALDRGTAGGSARREFERRMAEDVATHVQRIKTRTEQVQHRFGRGRIGRLAQRLLVDERFKQRPTTRAWRTRAEGEEHVAGWLEAMEVFGVVSMHDRLIPGTNANIDHLVVTPWGVWVIDSRRYIGRSPERTADDGLMVDGRRHDHLTDGVRLQCAQVRAVLDHRIPVRGALCFVDASWPRSGADFEVDGVRICWPERLRSELLSRKPEFVDVAQVVQTLADAFAPSVSEVLPDEPADALNSYATR